MNMGIISPINFLEGLQKTPGYISGAVVGYGTTLDISISAGAVECNGKSYIFAATSHTMTTLTTSFDLHYVYIDDSASAPPTPIFYDSVSEPVWDENKKGWYHTNGEDRMIGVVPSRNAAAEVGNIAASALSDKVIFESVTRDDLPQMAQNIVADSTWRSPNLNDGSIVTPVNATAIQFLVYNSDPGDTIGIYVTTAEAAAISLPGFPFILVGGYGYTSQMAVMNLGASRNLKISGLIGDDNAIGMNALGFYYSR
jgi:hypothetical protein